MKAIITYIEDKGGWDEAERTKEIDVYKEVYNANRLTRDQIKDQIEEMYSAQWMPELVSIELTGKAKNEELTTEKRLGYGEDEGEDQGIRLNGWS